MEKKGRESLFLLDSILDIYLFLVNVLFLRNVPQAQLISVRVNALVLMLFHSKAVTTSGFPMQEVCGISQS